MTHNAGEGTTSETKPINPPELQGCNSQGHTALFLTYRGLLEVARDQLAEAKDEIRALQAIIDADQHTDAWLDVLVKRYPGSTPWQDPTAGLNAADNRRAQ